MERTLLILKPDCVARGLCGEVLARLERKGLRLVALKLLNVPRALAEKHYAEHRDKPFFGELLEFITAGAAVPLVVEGRNAVAVCRKLLGKTDGAESEPGTIRGDFGNSRSFNLVHGSDSLASAEREIALWFKPEELVENKLFETKFAV
ncbi:nucleoside-diphosphate kinase [Planctomycetales bacterium]|nr:nucleoside-diphosphate kinase [Planctomycetales bacterium]GHS98433.1 nucleoside-diphosphate kinase [Planctomycetales bacterium]GHT05917.1 nucleoside-diphosphate kinase [Planctomycetales bacterium]GHV18636.1 nucleoside-diphosphate kinase [Planctomycetales bacterium]